MGPSPLSGEGDVSVLIVTYRTERVLFDCLESFEQHRPERVGEVLVIDNSASGSPSGAPERFPWISYTRNQENVHFRRGVNQGARSARGRYLLLLNPDTYLSDSPSIAAMAEVLDRSESIGFVGPMVLGEDGGAAPQGERLAGLADLLAAKSYLNTVWRKNPIRRRSLRLGAPRTVSGPVETVTAAVLLCRRDEFLAVGGLDERAVVFWEEQELARKLRRRGLSGWYCSDAAVHHRWRKGGAEHEEERVTRHHFEHARRVYYDISYGRLGTGLYDALELFQRVVRLAHRR